MVKKGDIDSFGAIYWTKGGEGGGRGVKYKLRGVINTGKGEIGD
jgi:hypothetical protein